MPLPQRKEIALRLLLSLGSLLLLLLAFCPPIHAFLLWARVSEAGFLVEVRRAGSVLEQLRSPGTAITDPLHGAIQWRLLFPALGHVLGLPAPALFGLAHVGCLALLYSLVSLLRVRGFAWGAVALTVLILGSASWFFTSSGWLGYYDAWLALGLVLVTCSRSRWALWAACLWAPWVDERFVMAFPLALACRHWLWTEESRDPETLSAPRRVVSWKLEYAVPAALVLAFVIVRLAVLSPQSSGNAAVGAYLATQHNLSAPPTRLLLGIWEGLRGGWLLLVAGLLVIPGWSRTKTVALVLVAGLVLAGLYTAQDFSRSMTMLLPLALCGAIALLRSGKTWAFPLLGAVAALSLLVPANHVMSDAVRPVHNLQHELYLLDNPPRALMPELFELEGIHRMEMGDNPGAEGQFSLAILLAERPVTALQHRGLLRANLGRWPEAKADFDTLVGIAPEDSNAWLLQAQACLALRDVAGARSGMQRALEHAPEGWSKRPDVQRFMARLNQR